LAVGLAMREARADLLPRNDDVSRPCRPTVSCTADLVDPGLVEVESGVFASRLANGDVQWSAPFLLKPTLTRALQIQIGSGGLTSERGAAPAQYLDNVYIGPKLRVLEQRGLGPSVALSAHASIPTFPRAGYAHAFDAFVTAYVSKDLGPVHIDWNGAWIARSLDGSPAPQGMVALAVFWALPAALAVGTELYGFSAAPTNPADAGVRPVVSFTARPWLVFDAGCDVGIVASTRSYSVFGGLTIVPLRLGSRD
jgi:hypothetical protein